MSPLITAMTVWLKTRLLTKTWLLMPVALFILGHGQAAYSLSLAIGVYLAAFFFRCFDDYFCFQHDLRQRSLTYQEHGSQPLLIMSVSLGSLYLWTLWRFFHPSALHMNLILIFTSVTLYICLQNHKAITLVSMLKYPVLLYMINDASGQPEWLWIAGISLCLLARELLEELLHVRSRKVEVAALLLLVHTKLFMRYA